MKSLFFSSVILFASLSVFAQSPSIKVNDSNTPLHLLQPDYSTPYGKTKQEDIKGVLDRVFNYLNTTTPFQLIDRATGKEVAAFTGTENLSFKAGDYRILSYEWGVTYNGMLLAGEITGDKKYTQYTTDRINFLAEVASSYRNYLEANPGKRIAGPVQSALNPGALDDAGAMCAAIIKATQTNAIKADVRPMIDNYISYIINKEFRLKDGTLARNRPQPNTLWLDDMYMALPAIGQMGRLTGDRKYFDEAVKQFGLFSKRMFNPANGLYMHGWVQGMDFHPQFHWGRANGWALLTAVELLDVLPADHPGRAKVLAQMKQHINGLAQLQSANGFWHQLLDRNDSYLETSATAIYAYCISHAINKGWIDAKAYGPMALLAWNAVSTKVNDKGQVEGTCVGTGMGFDPAFYYYRPVNVFAAHSYGPVLLAGAETYRLLKEHPFVINDSSVQINK